VHTQQNSATFDWVDLVSDKIEEIILPQIPIHLNPDGLTPQQGWQFSCVELREADNMTLKLGQNTAQTLVIKQLQFSLIISKIS
jgi:hypothetical protein